MNNVKEYRVITTPTFEREMKKLLKRNPRVARQIEQLLEFLRTDPYNRSGMRDIKVNMRSKIEELSEKEMISMSIAQLTFDNVLKTIQDFKPKELEVLEEEINKLKKLWRLEMTSFEIGVRHIQDTLANLVQNINPSNNFHELCDQARALSAYTEEQPRYRRHLLAMLQMALRRVNPSEITTEQRIAFQYLGNQLLLENPSFDDVVSAKKKLAQAQISMLPTMGELADEFIRFVKEDREPE